MNPVEAPLRVPPVADAEVKQQRLDQMKRRATGLLILMTAIFVVARLLEPAHPWLAYVRATAEAAMVGGVADWFAITALFRHPLGIAIPHTAIIPQRKDRIGRSLGNFVQNNFLSDEILGAKLRAARLSRRGAEWLSRPENGQAVARHAAAALQNASAVMRDEDVHAFLDGRHRADPAPAHRAGPGQGTGDPHDRRPPPAAPRPRGSWSLQPGDPERGPDPAAYTRGKPMVGSRFRGQSGARKVVTAIGNTLREVVDDPEHPLRRQFDELLLDWIVRLQESPEVMERAEAVKQQLLSSPTSRDLSASLWQALKHTLDRQAGASGDGVPGGLARGMSALAQAALDDEALLEKIDGWMWRRCSRWSNSIAARWVSSSPAR